MGRITMYAHHEVQDPTIFEQLGGLDESLRALGHDWTETALASEDLRHVLLVAEFGAPEDLVAHFEALEGEGWPGVLDGLARITVADVIGEVDDASRALLGKYDFVHFLSPVPD